MRVHPQPHPQAGESVAIVAGALVGQSILIEDWWDRIVGKSWMNCDGNPACLIYAMSSLGDPLDDEVIYGKIGSSGTLVHVTNLARPVPAEGDSV